MEELAFEVFATLGLGIFLGAMLLYAFLRLRGVAANSARATTMEFRFSNKELVGACRKAQRSFTPDDLDGTMYERLLTRLSDIFPDLKSRIETNSAHWDNFRLAAMTVNGPIGLEVTIDDTTLILQVSGLASPLAKQQLVDADISEAKEEELVCLRDAADLSPFPTWQEQSDGKIEWANKAYRDLCAKAETEAGANIPRLFHGGQIASTGQEPSLKRSHLSLKSGAVVPFEIQRRARKDVTLNFAADASKIAKAEETLTQFVQTLSQTFAALSTGIAVFDQSRNLVMFNPAMADLTTLDPCWLTSKPSLHDVIDQLRELRMIPERRDFKDWRDKIAELEASATEGTYCETWTLPNGQTYRFAGQPHPEGAIAFLIEDITAEMSLTRKFRRELALSQALVDTFPNALIVFGADGVIAMTNRAYHELWNTDTEDALDQLTVMDATRLWQSHSTPNPVWGDARDFAAQGGERAEWSDTVSLLNGRQLECWFQPLVGGATLAEFKIIQQGVDLNNNMEQLAAVSS